LQAGLFSAVTSAFIIQVHSQLPRDSNEETADLLRVLVYAANNAAFNGEVPRVPQRTEPPRSLIQVQVLLYTSLVASLFSASLTMFGKRWLNLYASADMRGSAIERSQNRQRKLDGFVTWRFSGAVESLALMLQIALLLFGCALSMYLWDINGTVASLVIASTAFGIVFYASIAVAGAASTDCPYQTFGAQLLRSLCQKVRNLFHIRTRTAPQSGARPGTAQASDEGVTILDFRCISWMLRTSLDRKINGLTLKFLGSVLTHPGFNDGVLADCLNVLINCVGVVDNGRVVVTKDSEQLAEMSAVCLLSALSHRLVKEPIFNVPKGFSQWRNVVPRFLYRWFKRGSSQQYVAVPGDFYQRYMNVFPSMDLVSDLPFYKTIAAVHSLITGNPPRHLNWDNSEYSSPETESLWLVHNFVKIAWYQKNKDLGSGNKDQDLGPGSKDQDLGPGNKDQEEHWVLRFACDRLLSDPELPSSVTADCLSIVAIELGCNISESDIIVQDKRYVLRTNYTTHPLIAH